MIIVRVPYVRSLLWRCFVRRQVRCVLACLFLHSTHATDLTNRVDFNFDVSPLLSDRCFRCHGPDEKARKAKLRLDVPEAAYALRDENTGKRAVVPGHPERSELYRRITTDDPDDQMPPAKSNLSLSAGEKELLRRWIAEGGEYKPHWAFGSVGDVPVPKTPGPPTARNPIDAFVLARLQREGLSFSPEASRETLIRRLSFDLTGLPPTLDETDQFLADQSADAYERLVGRLLASKAYGERRANEWLDLARYADTYGYQNDVPYDISPWRDWVIKAFNENLPYDQFITWQLAGDLLPAPTQEQVLATAFNRLHRQTNEGGSVDEEFRSEYVADRVNTTTTVFLGLTFECSRCHDHKFDPIKQKDYYRMSAFFNNIDESGLYAHFTTATPTPALPLYPEGVEAKHRQLKEEIRQTEADLRLRALAARPEFEAWLASGTNVVAEPLPTAAFSLDEIHTNTTPDNVGTNRVAWLVEDPTQVEGKVGHALRFSGDNSLVCKDAGAFNRTTPFSIGLWLKPAERQDRAVIFHRSRAWTDSASRGYELVLEEGKPAFGLIHFWPGNAAKIRATHPLPTNSWTHLTITYDGSSRASGMRIYLDGQLAETEIVRDNLSRDILHRQEWGDADVGSIELTLAARFRDSGFRNGEIDELKVFDRCLASLEVSRVARVTAAPPGAEALFAYYLQRLDGGYQELLAVMRKRREAENALIGGVREIMVMHEMAGHRATHVLKRGAYDAPGEAVEPGTPDGIFPFRAEWPSNRLGLARWITDRRNPLTARVAVNRAWRTHFGRGLVATAGDFGTQGQLPTHPALLDWLAMTFMDSGWDLKELHRLIVTSATYRQSSKASSQLVSADPDNRLLSRGPKHRLQAEQIRDNALASSGLLSRRIGGPSVRPYQPPGLWEEAGTGKHYDQDKGEGLYRRSLYTFWKRTSPPPSMLTFDATSREVCTAKRETTSTPLQALVLLNDPQYVEAARFMAEQLVRDSTKDLDARIVTAFRLTIGRLPTAAESTVLARLYQEQLDLFHKTPADAQRYVTIGDRPFDKTLPVEQVAATTVLANTLMSLDEFVMNR